MNTSLQAGNVGRAFPAGPSAGVGGNAAVMAPPVETVFDGIICFGGVDWWYHNRGHYDLQMMRELSATAPVLYVNSIGMRLTSGRAPATFLRRVRRKLASVARGRVQVRDQMWVFSPFSPPLRIGRRVLRRSLIWQVRSVSQAIGIRRPLLWAACPPAANVLEALQPHGVIYQRTDRFEEYPGVDPVRIARCDRGLKARADLTLFCSSLLIDEEREQCRRALFVDHGVDFDLFARAGENVHVPTELRHVPSPRVGYVGNLEPHRVDHTLLLNVARRLPDCHFVIVGPGPLEAELAGLPNVHRFPQQPYENVAAFMAACDVLIMPWNDNAWIRACNPVKLKEYLATGRPVVTTPFDELRRYEGVVHIARGPEAFAAAIRAAIQTPDDPRKLRDLVREETWAAKAQLVLTALRQHNIYALSAV